MAIAAIETDQEIPGELVEAVRRYSSVEQVICVASI